MNRLFSQLSGIITNHSFPGTSSVSTSRSSDRSDVEKGLFVPQLSVEERQGQRREVTIGMLPEEILLDIFNFYLEEARGEDRWHPLVHPKEACKEDTGRVASPPIVISGRGNPSSYVHGADNIIAALEHPDRVCHISLWEVPIPALETITAAMCEPFPDLTYLELLPHDTKVSVPVLPDTFLGGSAPHLQTLWLDFIPLGGLRKLLLSASDLVDLAFCIFLIPGVSEYLDDLVARINTPSLQTLEIVFFHQLVFNISHLPQFISRTEFSTDSEWQVSSLSQACISSLPTLPNLERLDIVDGSAPRPQWHDDMVNAQWLEPLRPFTAVKNLYLSKGLGLRVARALRELPGERATEVLPALQNIFFGGLRPSGAVREAMGSFVAARQLSGRPVAVHRWEGGL
ncbi:hypothetical protein BJV74DRAFT_952755 [Russula compacta]|nr:hypothetical protein BJV74DRAFT_952755 [Russula compacta]